MKRLLKLFHIHNYKPIFSRYRTFSSRDIIYECKCGKRKSVKVWRGFSDPFPIPTNHLVTRKEYQDVLQNGLS